MILPETKDDETLAAHFIRVFLYRNQTGFAARNNDRILIEYGDTAIGRETRSSILFINEGKSIILYHYDYKFVCTPVCASFWVKNMIDPFFQLARRIEDIFCVPINIIGLGQGGRCVQCPAFRKLK